MIADALLDRLYTSACAAQWQVSKDTFRSAIERSVAHGVDESADDTGAVRRYCEALHLDDLALACACADGHEGAWDHFVRTYRPHLYRAADSLAPDGSARELADALYGELFGLREGRDGQRRSHFHYFHGRSSLPTWLRAVLAQRHIDRVRATRRHVPIPDESSAESLPALKPVVSPERNRFVALMHAALVAALALLASRDRLRLGCYYAQQMSLAQVGRLLGEHEATVSRQLSKTRQALRTHIESHLREHGHLDEAGISACFESVVADTDRLDLVRLFESDGLPTAEPRHPRKESSVERSSEEHHQ